MAEQGLNFQERPARIGEVTREGVAKVMQSAMSQPGFLADPFPLLLYRDVGFPGSLVHEDVFRVFVAISVNLSQNDHRSVR